MSVTLSYEIELIIFFLALTYKITELADWVDKFQKEEADKIKRLSTQDQQKLQDLYDKLLAMDSHKFEKDGEELIRGILKLRRKYLS